MHEQIKVALNRYFPDQPVCSISGDLDAECSTVPDEALHQPPKAGVPRPYADDSRIILHDHSLKKFWKGKLNRPKIIKGREKVCTQQESRFLIQLQTGLKNHADAKNYFACLTTQQTGLDQELSYRLAHGSYKALSWSRDLASKWLALLAHYIPDAELQFLPFAGTHGPGIDFVHHEMPIEAVYAAALLLCTKIKPTIAEIIKDIVTTKFEGQDAAAQLSLSLKLYGTAKFLEQVGRAQIELMDAWLNPSIVDRRGDANIPRGEDRNAGIFRDFHDLGFIVNSPEPLNSVLQGFHAGTARIDHDRILPSFEEFRTLYRATYVGPV